MTTLEKRIERRNTIRKAIITALERAEKNGSGQIDTAVSIEVENEKVFTLTRKQTK